MNLNRIFIICAIFLGLSLSAFAQVDQFKTANDLYAKAQYTEAAQLYEQLVSINEVAPELYFNLGNSYYKLGEVGKSILNYERALRLKPSYEDAIFNLEMARSKVVDNVVQVPSFFIMRWIDSLIKLMSSNQWFWLSVVLLIITVISFFIFIFGFSPMLRRFTFYLGVVFLSFTVLTGFFAGIRKSQMAQHNQAIIMVGTIIVKGSPDKSGTDLFQLHEGTKVKVKSELGDWTEIVLGNGNLGWIEDINIEKI